ncbi:Hsp20/alpha crystallin family protein [Natrialba sp. SSL1]|uniref:Hsp20/alpha crystallin family protein n=1 Tax=Natrialba sp. SSL1 TaxID=1869245 RepID=UPI0009FD9E56|nr:Hsp20/alpha crystallin family protein [Natrialba sp. SSL1]
MGNGDKNGRENSKSSESDSPREENSLGAALEASLQAGLRSVANGLRNAVEGDTSTGTVPSRTPSQPHPSARRQANQNRGADTVRRTRESKSEECLLDTRFTDDKFTVTADLFGASLDDITVGVNPRTNELVIEKTGTVVGRVDLPWASPEIQNAWFKNGILEVHMKSDDADSLSNSPP